jgi:16S rRNA (cytosine1402-N4)-methyltransferase
MSEHTPDFGNPSAAVHQPVLLREAIRHLELQPGLIVADGTVGAGGHARKILEQIGIEGTLIGLDRDPLMLQLAARVVSGPNCHFRHGSYVELPRILGELGLLAVDRILLDLGLSSDQLADERRGFSFESAGLLDLRFDITQGRPAWQLLDELDESELASVFHEYGEERFSGPIARQIVARRQSNPVRTAGDLVGAVGAAVPGKFQREARKHPATRIFQALRIAVNDELKHLELALDGPLLQALGPGGRLVIITFHSLEDRLVKQAFQDETRWQNLTPKPVTPRSAEQRINPRSRTAKLRAAVKR